MNRCDQHHQPEVFEGAINVATRAVPSSSPSRVLMSSFNQGRPKATPARYYAIFEEPELIDFRRCFRFSRRSSHLTLLQSHCQSPQQLCLQLELVAFAACTLSTFIFTCLLKPSPSPSSIATRRQHHPFCYSRSKLFNTASTQKRAKFHQSYCCAFAFLKTVSGF